MLVRGLGRAGANSISDDQLLWAATLAAASCRCSIPVLVSCDWDGIEGAEGFGGERGIAGEGRGGVGAGGGGASCKGYSAPGSKGTACSVRFQTSWTDQVGGGVRLVGRKAIGPSTEHLECRNDAPC